MVDNSIEQAVFDLVEEYNGFSLFTFKRFKLEVDTDLKTDFRMDPDDAYELLERYTEQFNINPKDIYFDKYFPVNKKNPRSPLTIGMLIESAKAGRWLY
ncbi:DUF1493 family protein [Serratia ficaria]|uniref:DUF1493 family protein n=1 Tax=Serratia ficaria TaxID=61651 RepID=UPI002ED2DD69|nr:DUF1493 family protein [Serratia ficaria]